MQLKKAVRTAQTYAAPMLEVKAWTQRNLRSFLRRPSEASYRAFRNFPFESGSQFLDVGANRGQTIASIRLYKPNVPIMAFEPNPVLARWLSAHYASNQTVVHPFGLGTEEGHFDLYVPYYRGFMFDGLASFDWSSAHDWLNQNTMYGFRERHLRIEKIRCEVRRWDEVDTQPGLVKLDVQGFESKVISGGLQTIRNYRPVLLIENDLERAHERLLFREGYRRAGFDGIGFALDEVGRGNTFYLPEERTDHFQAAFISEK